MLISNNFIEYKYPTNRHNVKKQLLQTKNVPNISNFSEITQYSTYYNTIYSNNIAFKANQVDTIRASLLNRNLPNLELRKNISYIGQYIKDGTIKTLEEKELVAIFRKMASPYKEISQTAIEISAEIRNAGLIREIPLEYITQALDPLKAKEPFKQVLALRNAGLMAEKGILNENNISEGEIKIIKDFICDENPIIQTSAIKTVGQLAEASIIKNISDKRVLRILDALKDDSDPVLQSCAIKTVGQLAEARILKTDITEYIRTITNLLYSFDKKYVVNPTIKSIGQLLKYKYLPKENISNRDIREIKIFTNSRDTEARTSANETLNYLYASVT